MVQSQLPTVGPGALQCREDPNERAGKVRGTVSLMGHIGREMGICHLSESYWSNLTKFAVY